MGILTGIVGFSGSGKSSSMRTLVGSNGRFDKDTFLIRVLRKPLPFKNKLKAWDKDKRDGDFIYLENGNQIAQAIKVFSEEYGKKRIIVDDSTFTMVKFFMDNISDKGWDKFSVLAEQYYNILKTAEATPDDCRVYLVNHLEEGQYGRLLFKTIGKLISEKVDIPAMMTIILQAERDDQGYWFITNKRTDNDVAKSPFDMFNDVKIQNDLQLVDKTICDYYGI